MYSVFNACLNATSSIFLDAISNEQALIHSLPVLVAA